MGDIGVRVATRGIRPVDNGRSVNAAENVGDVEVAMAKSVSVWQGVEEPEGEICNV
jgi:hypothetical protein